MVIATAREAVGRLADEGLTIFYIDDLERLLGLRPAQAWDLAYRLQRVHMATRIRKGLYALVPPADWGRPGVLPANWYLTAAAIVHPAPYFLAYYTAMELHRMTRHPLRTVFVAVVRQRRGVEAGRVRFRFITVNKDRFFGSEERVVEEGRTVRVADLERTFLDCIDRPDLCGGLEDVARGYAHRRGDLNLDRLLRYVLQLDQPTLTKRLGFLLEVVGHGDPELLWELERLAGRLKRYVPLDKTAQYEGVRNKRWELVINTEVDRLLRAAGK